MSIYNNKKYCVYLTTYYGNKMPMFYIGSTTIKKIKSGYKGSVKSKKFKNIFNKELNENPQLFKTVIISEYYSRKKAYYKEKVFQTKLNVVKSSLYINMSIAKQFGWFGMTNKKEDSPVYGKRWKKTKEQIENSKKSCLVSFNKPEYKIKMSKIRTGKLPLSQKQIDLKIEMYKNVFNIYNSKPELTYNYVCKNGKIMTYDRKFAITYAEHFNMSVKGLNNIISKSNLIVNLL